MSIQAMDGTFLLLLSITDVMWSFSEPQGNQDHRQYIFKHEYITQPTVMQLMPSSRHIRIWGAIQGLHNLRGNAHLEVLTLIDNALQLQYK